MHEADILMYKVLLSFLRSTCVVDTSGGYQRVTDSHSSFHCFFSHKQARLSCLVITKRRWRIILVNGIYNGVNGIDSSREFARWSGVYKGDERRLDRKILLLETGRTKMLLVHHLSARMRADFHQQT